MANVIDLAQYKYTLQLDSGQYASEMKKSEGLAENMKSKLSGIGGFMKASIVGGLVAAASAITGTIVAGVHATADLEEQVSKFKASTGATAEEAQKIKEISQDLYRNNTDSMEDIVATAGELKKAMGLTTDEIGKYQQAFMDYAKTTGQANTDVVGAIDDIGDAWGLTTETSVKSLDMLKKSSEEFGTDIVAVQDALTKVAPASKALGMSLEETNGVMNLFAASGLDASQSITAFTYASKNVKSPEEFKTMLADIQAISDPTQRAQAAVELFGARAGVALSNALDGTNIDEFIVSMDEATGTVARASGEFDNNFNIQLELAKKQFLGLSQELGEKFMPILAEGLKFVTDKMPIVVGVIEESINFIGRILDPFISVVKSVMETFKETDSTTTYCFNNIKETISSVIMAIQTIVQIFINIFSAMWSAWGDEITAIVSTYFGNIKKIINSALDYIQGIAQLFTALFKGDWEACFEALKDITKSGWELIKSLFQTAIDLLIGIINLGFNMMATIAKNLMELLWNGIKGVWNNIMNWFKGAINGLVSWFGSLGSTFLSIGTQMFTWVWDGLKSVWTSISTWVSEKVQWLTDKLSFWRSSQSEMNSGGSVPADNKKSSAKRTSSSSSSSSSSSTKSSGSTGIFSGVTNAIKKFFNGSHADGLAYVPFDNYAALLHKGERVLTAQENSIYSSNRQQLPNRDTSSTGKEIEFTFSGDIILPDVRDAESFGRELIKFSGTKMKQILD